MPDRHKTKPKAVRLPDGLLAWYEEHAKATGQTVHRSLVAALEDFRARNGGATATAIAAESGTTARPARKRADSAPAQSRCTHPGIRVTGGWCPPCQHEIQPGGRWA